MQFLRDPKSPRAMFARLTDADPRRENRRQQFSAKILKLWIGAMSVGLLERGNSEYISTLIVSRAIKLTSYVNHM